MIFIKFSKVFGRIFDLKYIVYGINGIYLEGEFWRKFKKIVVYILEDFKLKWK